MKWKIDRSNIHGCGVFAKENIKSGDSIGRALIFIYQTLEKIVYERNTLGLMINDSNEPNAVMFKLDKHYHVVAIKNISELDEILVSYKQYEDTIKHESVNENKSICVT